MANTITRSQALEVVINGGEVTPEIIEVLQKMKDSIDKKASGSSKASEAKRQAREALADSVAEFMVGKEPMQITQIINAMGLEVSTSAMTSAIGKDDRFTSEKIKGKSMYRLA